MELNICLIGCGMMGKDHIERIPNRIRGARGGASIAVKAFFLEDAL